MLHKTDTHEDKDAYSQEHAQGHALTSRGTKSEGFDDVSGVADASVSYDRHSEAPGILRHSVHCGGLRPAHSHHCGGEVKKKPLKIWKFENARNNNDENGCYVDGSVEFCGLEVEGRKQVAYEVTWYLPG